MFRLGHFSKTLGPREEGSEAESEKSRDSAELSEDETSEMSEFDVCFSERVAVFYVWGNFLRNWESELCNEAQAFLQEEEQANLKTSSKTHQCARSFVPLQGLSACSFLPFFGRGAWRSAVMHPFGS